MKKKIALFIFVALVISKTFAGEHAYFEYHFRPLTWYDFHYKVYAQKKDLAEVESEFGYQFWQEVAENSVRDAATLNRRPNEQWSQSMTIILGPGCGNPVVIVTFSWRSSGYGAVQVKLNSELIYENEGYSFNYCYEIYQDQCNKYLNMY